MASNQQPMNGNAPSSPPSSPTRRAKKQFSSGSISIPGNGNNSNSSSHQLSQPSASSRARPSGALVGMLRKTKKKSFGAIYSRTAGRGKRSHRHVRRGEVGGSGEMVVYDSSSSDSSSTGGGGGGGPLSSAAMNFSAGRNSGRGAQAASISIRSPFTTPRVGGGGAGVEPVRSSFYFSPNNNSGTRNAVPQQQQPINDNGEALKNIVCTVERTLRQIVLCCAAFIAGTMMTEWSQVARHALELSLVAWGTCMLILVLGWIQNYKQQRNNMQQIIAPTPTTVAADQQHVATPMMNNLTQTRNAASSRVVEPPSIERLDRAVVVPTKPKYNAAGHSQDIFKGRPPTNGTETSSSSFMELSKKRSHDDFFIEPADKDSKPPQKAMRKSQSLQPPMAKPKPKPKQQKQQRQVQQPQKQHPQLEGLYVMMVGKQERVFPNSTACEIDSELFKGKMLTMFRTSEADEPSSSGSTDPVVNYFRGKQRRFEFQWQFKLKKLPPGDVFMGMELDEPIQMGMIQRALANTALKFVKKMNQGFTYFLSDSIEIGPSYLSFPVGTSMDRFHASKPGETLPVLGQEVLEDAEGMKLRKKGMKIEWNTEDVYTMAVWSAYFDWIDWQILNFPGIRPFSANSMAGVQPIKMTLYTTSFESTEKNPKRDIVLAMEMSNAIKSTLGSESKKWNAEQDAAASERLLVQQHQTESIEEGADEGRVESSEIDSVNGNETSDEEDEAEDVDEIVMEGEQFEETEDMGNMDDLEEEDEGFDMDETMNNMSIEASCYLFSGSSISLREGTGNYVASGGGYAVLQSSPTSYIVLEKNQSKKKKGKAQQGSSMMIRSGDVVQVKLVDTTSVKYLSLYRGWWLRWSSNRPKRNGTFYIRSSGEPDGSLLVLGCPFSLVSRRWSHYLVGACNDSSAKYGGRMLGIYKTGKNNPVLDDVEVGGEEDDEENELDDIDFPVEKISRDKRMMPLLLCADAYQHHSTTNGGDLPSPAKSPTQGSSKLTRQVSLEDAPSSAPSIPILGSTPLSGTEKRYEIDVPVWLEVMNRTKRTKQLVYAVRVKETTTATLSSQSNDGEPSLADDSEIEPSGAAVSDSEKKQNGGNSVTTISRMFVKLRTGSQLAPVLRLGVEHKPELTQPSDDQWQQPFDFTHQDDLNVDADSFTSSSDDSEESDEDEELEDEISSHFFIAGPNHSGANKTFTADQANDSFMKLFSDDNRDEQDIEFKAATSPTATQQQDLSTNNNSAGEQIMEKHLDDSERQPANRKGKFSKRPSTTKRDISIDSENTSYTTEGFHRRDSSLSLTESKRGCFLRANSQNPSDTANQLLAGQDNLPTGIEAKKKAKAKHAAMIGRVAKTVRSSTVITGKHVIKHSKNIGKGTVKGTVSAGRAAGRVIPSSVVYNYKPPRKHEPGGRVHRKRSDKGQMKMIGRAIKNIEGQGTFSTFHLSGQLLAPDQSCRKISQILSGISNTSNTSEPIADAISSLATSISTQDLAFLRGGSAELGVKPLKPVDSKSDIDCVVARCIYEGRWREELCVLYSKGSHLAFYAPLAKKPNMVVSFDEIMSARKCDENSDGSSQPVPGFKLLVIETAWKCHYLAFLEHSERDNFLARLNDALFYTNNCDVQQQPSRQSRKMSQDYESYRLSLETSLTGTVGKWRAVSISKKSKQNKPRRVLNGRRMTFDLVSVTDKETDLKGNIQDKVAAYVENLLRMALSFSSDALDGTDSRFIEFLDEVSRLRTLPLHEIDLSSREAFCIFVNLYHCLLQHSLLLAVDGLPNKRSVTHFKRCSCYEIGEDVFSLAELECCVIRGKTSRPVHMKPPFVDVAKKSRPYQMMYGLGATDFRINFILNNGDLAYPSAVPVLQHQIMDDQMETTASCFLADQVKIDKRKRTVFLPKVCDVYRNDFGMGDGIICLSQCMIYLEEKEQLAIASLLDDGVVSVKFQRNCEDFRPNLTLR